MHNKQDFLTQMQKVQKITLENLMIHDEMANFFNFLNLQGYKRWHENEHLENITKNRLINRFIISKGYLPLNVQNTEQFNIIPAEWHTHNMTEVSGKYTLEVTKQSFKDYLERMLFSKNATEEIAVHFSKHGDLATYKFLSDMVEHFDKDIKYLTRYVSCLNKAESVDYIMEKQDKMHDEFRDELKDILEPLVSVKY